MKTTLLSIIVPYYNSNKYIERCILSILNQTHKDFELILVDDGSTDNSFQICQHFASIDNRIILLQKKNEGQGTARNLGLDNANGYYIGFVDSDDFIEPKMYEILINEIAINKADIAICGYNVFRYNSNRRRPLNYISNPVIYDNFDLMKAYVSTSVISAGPCNKLYKKELFDEIRFASIRIDEDSRVMPLLLMKANKGVHVGKCLYNWFWREGSTSRSKFIVTDLEILNSAKSLESCIIVNYPSLYEFVALHIDSIRTYLMKKIIWSNNLKEYKNTYQVLLSDISRDEFQRKQFKQTNAKKYHKIEFACQYNRMFIIYEFINGNIRRFTKRLLLKLNTL